MTTATTSRTSIIALSLSSYLLAQSAALAQTSTTAGRSTAQTPTSPGLPQKAAEAPLSLVDVIRATLRLHPEIATARAQLSARSAEAEAALGPFDPRFSSRVSQLHEVSPIFLSQRTGTETTRSSDTTDFTLGAALPTTWGTTITPNAGVSRIYQRAPGALPSPGIGPYQQAHVGITVNQPLLRGAGRVGAASAIEATRLNRDAAQFALAQTAQQQVYAAIVAYYELIATTQQLNLYRAIEEGARKLVEDTRVLVESDQRPRSDLRQLEANLSNRHRAVIEAENARVQAVYAVGLAMGLRERELFDFRAVDELPIVPATLDRHETIENAIASRNDLKSAQTTLAAESVGLRGAEHNTLPALDLGASIGFAGALNRDGVDAFVMSPSHNVRGLNMGVSLSLELPIRNTAATAQRNLLLARVEQAEITASTLTRTVPIAVKQASEDLRLSSAALDTARVAVAEYEQVVADQTDKLRAGVGTAIDMILTEELLIAAQQSLTSNRLRCAVAQVRLLLETGALPRRDDEIGQVVARLSQGGRSNAEK